MFTLQIVIRAIVPDLAPSKTPPTFILVLYAAAILSCVLLTYAVALRRQRSRSSTWPGRASAHATTDHSEEAPSDRVPGLEAASLLGSALFPRPHTQLKPLQHLVAKRLLGRVHATYLPRRLERALEEHSATRAIHLFLGEMGMEYEVIAASAGERRLFRAALVALKRTDPWVAESGMDDTPLLRVIRARNLDDIEAVATRLEAVARIWRVIRFRRVDFPLYETEFRGPVSALLRDWITLEAGEIAEVMEVAEAWLRLQIHFDHLRNAVTALVGWIGARAEIDARWRVALVEIDAASERAVQAVLGGDMEAAEGIDALQELVDDLVLLAGALADDDPPQDEPAAQWLRTLGLRYPRDLQRVLIRIAFRQRVKALHPSNGGNLDDFCELMRAYCALLDHLVDENAILPPRVEAA